MNSTLKSLVFWMVLVVVGVIVWNLSTRFQPNYRVQSFSDFIQSVESGQVARVTITGNEITGQAKNDGANFRTYAPPQYEGLANRLIERGVAVTAKEPTTSPWAALLYSWAPILLMIGFWIFFMRQMQSGGNKALSFGKSKAKLSSSAQKKVTFKDVAGVDEDDAGSVLLALFEQVTHARGAHADEHLDEIGAADREERHVRFARDRARKQRLAGAGRAHEEDALGNAATELLELLRLLQELDDLLQLVLRLVHAGDVLERHLLLRARRQLRLALAERQRLVAAALHLAHDEDPEADHQQDWRAVVEQRGP